jgi:plastocyanin
MKRLLAVLTVSILALSACGGSEDTTDSEQSDGSGGAGSAELTVVAQDFQFSPTELNVEAGADVTIEFTNEGDAPHTFTAEDIDVDESLDPGGSTMIEFTAGEAATIEWHCTIHTSMTGTITVGEGSDAGAGSSSNDSDSLDY